MSYQISVRLESMSPSTYHYREGVKHYRKFGVIETDSYEKLRARKSCDEMFKKTRKVIELKEKRRVTKYLKEREWETGRCMAMDISTLTLSETKPKQWKSSHKFKSEWGIPVLYRGEFNY